MTTRPPTGTGTAVPVNASDPGGPPVDPDARFNGVIHLPVDPEPEPRRRRRSKRASGAGGVVAHRRRVPPAAARRLRRIAEVAAWAVGLALLAGIATYLVGGRPQAGSAHWVDPVWTVTPERPCGFEPCPEPTYSGEPTRLRIASIGVDAPLERLDLGEDGELNPPRSFARPGWWRQGIAPGNVGPAVIAGHVDSYTGPAVFYRLHTLRAGDVVEVRRGDAWVRFVVTAVEQYPKDEFPTAKVYRPTPGAELRLITCGGDFDSGRRSYRDNIVVYARLAAS